MADQYTQGVDLPYSSAAAGAIVEDAFGVLVNFQPNRYPLTDKLRKEPLGSPSFNIISDSYRPRSAIVVNGGTSVGSGSTSLPVADASIFDLHDVLEVLVTPATGSAPAVYEDVLVTAINAAPVNGSASITIQRGYAGTTAQTIPDGSPIFLLTNTRTGGEININAITRLPGVTEQFSQTIQHAYQIAGALESSTSYVSGYGSPVQRDKWLAMTATADDFEGAMYYGKGVKLAPTTASGPATPGMKGLRTLIQTNNTSLVGNGLPQNSAAYKPTDWIRDLVNAPFKLGGEVDMVLCPMDFQLGLSIWGIQQTWLDAGTTLFGVAIRVFSVPFAPGVMLAVAPLLRPGDFIGLCTNQAGIRMKRPLFDKPRGSRGDAIEGDMIQDGAIAIENEQHHSFVSGVTGYAKQS